MRVHTEWEFREELESDGSIAGWGAFHNGRHIGRVGWHTESVGGGILMGLMAWPRFNNKVKEHADWPSSTEIMFAFADMFNPTTTSRREPHEDVRFQGRYR